MKLNTLFFTIAIILAGMNTTFAAEQYIYKWKDTSGQVNYTERPPEAGIAYQKVRRVVDEKAGDARLSQSDNTSVIEKRDAEQEDKYASWKEQNCKIANQNLDVLQNAARINKDDGKGGKRLMTEEEKAQQIKKMTEQRDRYCIKTEE